MTARDLDRESVNAVQAGGDDLPITGRGTRARLPAGQWAGSEIKASSWSAAARARLT